MIDFCKLGQKTNIQVYFIARKQRFFERNTENIFVLTLYFPIFCSVNTGNLHAPVTFSRIIGRGGIDGGHRLISGVLAISVRIQVELQFADFVCRRIFVFHFHHRGQCSGFGNIFGGNLIYALAAFGIFTADRSDHQSDKAHGGKQKTKNTFHKKITPKKY